MRSLLFFIASLMLILTVPFASYSKTLNYGRNTSPLNHQTRTPLSLYQEFAAGEGEGNSGDVLYPVDDNPLVSLCDTTEYTHSEYVVKQSTSLQVLSEIQDRLNVQSFDVNSGVLEAQTTFNQFILSNLYVERERLVFPNKISSVNRRYNHHSVIETETYLASVDQINLEAGLNLVKLLFEETLDEIYLVICKDSDPSLTDISYIKTSNSEANDGYHFSAAMSVALDGDTLVIGMAYEDSAATGIDGNESDNSASGSGAVYVYRLVGGTWTKEAYLKASNTEAGDAFGWHVAIHEDTIVVGAIGEDSAVTGTGDDQDQSDNTAPGSGAVYVFVRDGNTWTQQAYLKARNADDSDTFGIDVAIYGDTIVVGAPTEESNATGVNGSETDNSAGGAGAAYVFVRSGTTWSQQAYLKASDSDASDSFGNDVSIHENTIVVGAPLEGSNATGVDGDDSDDSANNAGAAYVFVRSGVTWSQQAYLKASNTNSEDQFGISVSVDNDTIVVGANSEDSSATGVNGDESDNSTSGNGAAYVFVRNAGTWSQQAYLKSSAGGRVDGFGWAVVVEGNTIVVSTSGEGSGAIEVNGDDTDDSVRDSGAAYVFSRSGNTWMQTAYLKATNTERDDYFGNQRCLALSGGRVAIGAPGEDSSANEVGGNQEDNNGTDSGAVYVFE